uniref:CD80-like immunoglobulin C2-set domain-containing protein n=2 Tax=Graphocephala atropunctata TaxID=36148 RepID=A0A1B6M839_9HEMI
MCCLGALFLAITLLKGTWGVRNVTLLLNPPVVERGKNVELVCKYDLEGVPLYTIKFYRGTHEFYRYSPMDVPPIKLFLFHGLEIDLDLSHDSNVVVQGADYSLAGNISCEVTTELSTEESRFSTDISTNCLSVVELPKEPPQISPEVEERQYEAGDRLRANCTSGPARPAPILAWFINDEPAMAQSTRWNHTPGSLETRTVTLDTRVLPRHVTTGRLLLKCTAVVADIYKETVTMVLLSPQTGEPKHERVLFSTAVSVVTSVAAVFSALTLALALTLGVALR